jgi:hypothetical protein
MKTIIIILSVLIINICHVVYSQELTFPNSNAKISKGHNTAAPNDPEKPQIRIRTEREKAIEQEMKILRKSSVNNSEKLIQLQKELDAISGEAITLPGKYFPAYVIINEKPVPFAGTDDIHNLMVHDRNNVRSIALAVEQRQPSRLGRIWLMVCYRNGASSSAPDTAKIYYSTRGGVSWVDHATINLYGTYKFNYEELDIEIMENYSGDKYLWFTAGLRADGGTGRWLSVIGSHKMTGLYTTSISELTWPASSPDKRYYCPRITTDNLMNPDNSVLYIACSFDSSLTAGRSHSQKFAEIFNTYTTTPVITYRGPNVYWLSNTDNYQRYLYTDIAFFQHDSEDSLIFSFSGVADSTKLFFTKSNIGCVAPTHAGQTIGPIGGSQPNDRKKNVKIASNGTDNGSIICIFNQTTNNRVGVKYFRTTNWGDFNTIAGESTFETGVNGTSMPNIFARRGYGVYKIAYVKLNSSVDSLIYYSLSPAGTISSAIFRMNLVENLTEYFGPVPGIRYVDGDSCFAAYSPMNAPSVWVAYGCTGPLNGIEKETVPVTYRLEQNYPNPFNPSTTITFSIPKKAIVRIAVYNVLGKEISVIINKYIDRGNYNVTFDGKNLSSGIYYYKLETGSYTDVKKMVLIK